MKGEFKGTGVDNDRGLYGVVAWARGVINSSWTSFIAIEFVSVKSRVFNKMV